MNPSKAAIRCAHGALARSLNGWLHYTTSDMLDPRSSIPTRCDMTSPRRQPELPTVGRSTALTLRMSCKTFTCVIQRTMILNEPLQRTTERRRGGAKREKAINNGSLQNEEPTCAISRVKLYCTE